MRGADVEGENMTRQTMAGLRADVEGARRTARRYLWGWWGTLALWALSVTLDYVRWSSVFGW